MAYIYDLTDTWNAGGTTFNGIKLNVTDSASAVTSKLVSLQTNGAEHFSVTKAGVGYFSGNLLVGTTAAYGKLTVYNTTNAQLALTDGTLGASYGGAVRGFGVGGKGGHVELGVLDAGTYSPGIRVTEQANAILFFGNGGAERMRIDASGNLLVGKSTLSAVTVGASIEPGGTISSTRAGSTSATSTLEVYSTGAGAYRFYVDMSGTIGATNTSISAISDIRLKENVRDLDTGLDTILALKPRRFDWKEGKGKDVKDDMGFIAQEVEEVLPALIGGWKAGEGEPDDLKSVKAGDLIPVLVKAIQELTARVAQLEGN